MTQSSSKRVIWMSSLALLFVVIFCVAFVGFYTRNARNAAKRDPVNSGKPLPEADLVDENSKPLPETELKNGRIVLVFITSDCDEDKDDPAAKKLNS